MGGLPTIDPYDLPGEHEIPESRVKWRVDRTRAALLVHDMQRYFARPFPDGAPLTVAIRHIDLLRERCDAAGIPVIYTAQPGGQDPRDRGLQADFWGTGMPASDGLPEIVPELTPAAGHFVLTKWRYSAFQRTTLEHLLRARGRDQLIITGIYAHIGILTTALDAFMRDVRPFIVADGVADFSRERHDFALAHVARCCGVVTSTAALLKEL